MVRALPQLLPTVQALLLDTISIALFNKPFSPDRPPTAVQTLSQAISGGEHQGSALIKVSLRTLSAIDFDAVPLLPFVYSITEFLDNPDPSVRKVSVCVFGCVFLGVFLGGMCGSVKNNHLFQCKPYFTGLIIQHHTPHHKHTHPL